GLPEQVRLDLTILSQAGSITTRQAEGYAFYALYPESYIAAARQSGLDQHTTIIGIRSIGAGLAALVGAALGASCIHTVRPVGHPFERRLALSEALANQLAGDGAYAIADEGPGLSGSSFNCVADWLVEHGVAEERIHFFPSHGGDLGSAAQPRHRQRWARAHKHLVGFEQLVLTSANPAHRLENWIGRAAGGLRAPLREVSGGAWRDLAPDADHLACPADPALERRKFLAYGDNSTWLAKFAGVGRMGEAKKQLAQTLAEAGFGPEPVALSHGFLVTPWVTGKSGMQAPVPHGRVLDYLALRASLPAPCPGASLPALYAMATHNIAERCGAAAGRAVQAVLGDPDRFTPVACCTDNRMHAWEWINTPAGWFKLDGIDHHAAHDLVGCQDIAWDLAGAVIELGISGDQRDALRGALAVRIGRAIDPRFVAAMEICYLGFQIGLWTMARARNNRGEAQRIDKLLHRYEQHLALKPGVGGLSAASKCEF
ncbi:MAG: Cell division protein FtsK, partial [Devosia sp.]|nr:Cell division protein FtsK [Devosia sp.]